MEYSWLAAYTNPRAEKKVYQLLLDKQIETYLPLVRRLKQWSDRKKWVEEPLIRSYIFVKISEKEYFEVLNTPGLVRFITFEGKAAAIPENQIDTLRKLLSTDTEVEVIDTPPEVGSEITISKGSLLGLKGELIDYKQRNRVVVKLEHVGKSLLINVPLSHIEVIHKGKGENLEEKYWDN